MLTMIGLSGSLRQGFFNSSLLRAAAELMPEGVELRIATEDAKRIAHLRIGQHTSRATRSSSNRHGGGDHDG